MWLWQLKNAAECLFVPRCHFVCSTKVTPELPIQAQVTDTKYLTACLSLASPGKFLTPMIQFSCSEQCMWLYTLHVSDSNMNFSVTPSLLSLIFSLALSFCQSFSVSWCRWLPSVVKIRWWDCHDNMMERCTGYFWGCTVHSEELDDTDVSSRGRGSVHMALHFLLQV